MSEHIAASGSNTFGTTFDLLIRPGVSPDPRCNEIIKQVVESVMVAFPAAAQQAIEDAVVAAISAADGRFASLNLNKISTDPGNMAQTGSDGGVYVGRRFASASVNAGAGVAGVATLGIPFNDTNYIAAVEAGADPGGTFRWWVISKTASQLTVGFFCTNAVPVNVYAKG